MYDIWQVVTVYPQIKLSKACIVKMRFLCDSRFNALGIACCHRWRRRQTACCVKAFQTTLE